MPGHRGEYMSWLESMCADITVTTDKKSSEYYILMFRSIIKNASRPQHHYKSFCLHMCYGLRRMDPWPGQ